MYMNALSLQIFTRKGTHGHLAYSSLLKLTFIMKIGISFLNLNTSAPVGSVCSRISENYTYIHIHSDSGEKYNNSL